MNQPTEKCFIDMDGVLADFVSGVCKAYGRPNPYTNPANFNIFEIEDIWQITPKEFWAPCDGPTFWEDLKPMPGAGNLVDIATMRFGQENVCVLTSPSLSPYCVPGKRKWLKQWFPELKYVLFGSAKHFLAHPTTWLLDDRNENVAQFTAAGGNGVLVPRRWNAKYAEAPYALTAIRRDLNG